RDTPPRGARDARAASRRLARPPAPRGSRGGRARRRGHAGAPHPVREARGGPERGAIIARHRRSEAAMRRPFRISPALLALVLGAAALSAGESKKLDRSVPFRPEETKLGLKVDKVTIESVRVRHWPDPDDFRKA